MAKFADLLKRQSREVGKLELDQAAEFLRLLRETRDALAGRLAAHAPDKALDAWNLNRVLAETEAGILVLERKASGLYRGAADEWVDLAIEHIAEGLDAASREFDRAPLEVNIEAQKVLADPAQGLLANHFESSVKRYGLDLLNGVRQRVFIGLKAGDSVGAVVRDIAGDKGPLGKVGRGNGERLVRTEVSQAYGAAGHAGLREASKQVPGLVKVWLKTGSYECKICGPLHGTERPLDGTWSVRVGSKMRTVAHPPIHPNDACRVSAMKPSWRKAMQRLGYLAPKEGDGPMAGL